MPTPSTTDSISNAPAQTVSLTGVLRRPGIQAWIPHDTGASEAEGVAAIIAHMQIDALRPDLIEALTGPVHWHGPLRCYHAWGNFVICSAGFEITPLSDAARSTLLDAWALHRISRQYMIAQELDRLDTACKGEIDHVRRQLKDPYRYQDDVNEVRKRFRVQELPLERELESIYNAGRVP
jgi:hypothetical protein